MLSRKSRVQCLCFLLFVILLMLIYISFQCRQVNRDQTSVLLKIPVSVSIPTSDHINSNRYLSVLNGTKNILVLKYSWVDRYATGRYPFVNAGCRVSDCRLTTDTGLVNESNFDAYLVYVPTQKTRWELKSRMAHQVFILFSLEPPSHVKNLTLFENYFNWTMTYLIRSDFLVKYGEIVPLESAPKSSTQVAQFRQNVRESGVNPSRGKSRLVAWLVSNCQADSNQQEYAKILSKWIEVDVFSKKGRCGGTDLCSRSNNTQCQDYIERTYKFYLSFENSIC